MNLKDFLPKKFYPPSVQETPPKRTRRKKVIVEDDPSLSTGTQATIEPFSDLLPEEMITIAKTPIYEGAKHWKLAATTVVNPHPMNVPNDPAVTRLSFTGKTTYLFVCEETGEFRKEEVEGVEPTDLDMLVEKVENSGPEYIVRQTGTYIMMKKPQDVLPVR